jgi:hypothetical protein
MTTGFYTQVPDRPPAKAWRPDQYRPLCLTCVPSRPTAEASRQPARGIAITEAALISSERILRRDHQLDPPTALHRGAQYAMPRCDKVMRETRGSDCS